MGTAMLMVLIGLGVLAAGILIGRYYVPDDRRLKRTARHGRAYLRSLNLLLSRDLDGTIEQLREVVEEDVSDIEPYFALGALFRRRGEWERAIRTHQAIEMRADADKHLRLRALYELGLDFRAASMLEVAASRLASYANVTLVRADAQDLPFADRSFAGINNAGALHVYNDAEAVFQEVYRVLAPNGVYVGSTFAKSKGPLGSLAARVTGIRRFDPPELHAWLSRIGFAEYEEVRLGDAVLFKARKP